MRRGRPLRLAAAALAVAVGLVAALPAAAFAYSGSSDATPATESSMISSAVVDGESLTIEFGQLMQGTFDPDDWTWAIDGEDQGHPHLVMWVGGLGRAKLTVTPEVVGGQQVTLSYTPGDGSLLRDGADNQLAAFTAHPVRNDSPQPVVVVSLDLDDVTEETRELASGDGPDQTPFFDPNDRSSDGYVQQPKLGQPAVQPDSESLLHGRDNEADGPESGGKSQDHAQSFTTGTHRFGYALTAVSFDICFGSTRFTNQWNDHCGDRPADQPDDPTYQISLWTARRVPATGNTGFDDPGYYVPDTQVATFDKANDDPLKRTPSVPVLQGCGGGACVYANRPDTAINSFTTSGGPVLLDPDTTYVVVFDFTSTDGADPHLVRSGDGRHTTEYGFFIQSGRTRQTVRPGDLNQQLAPWERWHAHLTRSSSVQGPGGWTYGRLTYRIQLDGYEYNPPTLSELGPDFSQVGQSHPGGCGGNPMPWMSLDDIKAGLHHYCHNPSGTWVKGRWPDPQ